MEIPGQGSGLVTVPPEPGDETPPPVEVSSSGAAQGNEDGRLRPGAKRVTFPSDEDIVSGAVEPKDPWRHGNRGPAVGVGIPVLDTGFGSSSWGGPGLGPGRCRGDPSRGPHCGPAGETPPH